MKDIKMFAILFTFASLLIIGVTTQSGWGADCGACGNYHIDNATENDYDIVLITCCGEVGPINVPAHSAVDVPVASPECCIEKAREVVSGIEVDIFDFKQLPTNDYLRVTDGCYVLLSITP